MPNFLIKLTLDIVIGFIAGATSSYLVINFKKALDQHKINEILRAENVKIRREKDELQLTVLQNQVDITLLKETQEDLKIIGLQCLEFLGELTKFKDSESLNATYAATLRFRKKFGLKTQESD